MNDDVIKLEVSDSIALVTMDNPPVNALSPAFRRGMMEAFDSLNDRDDVRVAVLTGAGKHFCAGADLKARSSGERKAGAAWQGHREARETFHCIVECKKPVIAAINGAALGAGLAIAASCDILIASENTLDGSAGDRRGPHGWRPPRDAPLRPFPHAPDVADRIADGWPGALPPRRRRAMRRAR